MKNIPVIAPKKYDLIVIPGLKLGPRWGMRKDLRARLHAVIKAYQESPGAHIVVCGRWSIWYDWLNITPPITECKRMKTYLVRHGVAREDIAMESRSKDTIGNVYYLKRYVRTMPQYKKLLVVCAEQHEKRLEFLFYKFFGAGSGVDFLSVKAPQFNKDSATTEAACLREQKMLLAYVRPGHEEDFQHQLYNGVYYTHQAAIVRKSA